MNKKTFSLFVRWRSVRAIVLLTITAIATLASCSSEDMTENQVETLPEGMYPLTFTATQGEVVATPQSRVSENTDGASSKWDGGEVINVAIGKGGLGDATAITCTLKADGSVSTCSKQLYWQNTQSSTVSAWYSNITGQGTMTSNTVSLDKQNTANGLAYVLKTDEISPKYNTDNGKIALNFKHKLAKVRVKVVKGSYTGALDVTAVSVNGYTSCTVSNGDVSPSGSLNPIQMNHNDGYWEANLVPGTGALGNVITINADSKSTTCTLASAVTLTAAQMYTYEVTVNQAGPTVITGGQTITESGNYIIKGEFTQGITLNGDDINLTLEGVTANIGNAIKVTGGSPTIIVKGTSNSFDGDGAGILISPNANVTIQGATTNAADSKLIIKAGTSIQPGIGCNDESNCNNITINNVTLDVTGGYGKQPNGFYGGAAIGTAGNFGSSVNDILIENSIVTATGGVGAAAIGFGCIIDSKSINSIKIIKSKITAYVQYSSGDNYVKTTGYGAGIGFPFAVENNGHYLTIVQPIVIESTETSSATYFNSFYAMKDGSVVNDAIHKVGKPINSYSHHYFNWQKATFNGNALGDDIGY